MDHQQIDGTRQVRFVSRVDRPHFAASTMEGLLIDRRKYTRDAEITIPEDDEIFPFAEAVRES